MRIFVTGATGFIGSHFINAAHFAGHEVVAVRRSAQSNPRVPLDREPIWLDKEMRDVTEADLRTSAVLVHLAAVGITPQPATWDDCYQFNVIDTLGLARKALSAGVGRLVVTGTYAEYGLAGLRFDPIPPDAPLEPTDPYAASKASAGIALTALCRTEKFELGYYRLFSVYGEGQFEKNFWPQLRKAAISGENFPMTEGDQVRDFISVNDTAWILLSACESTTFHPGRPVVANLASGNPVTLREFAEKCWKQLNGSGRLLFGAVPSRPNEVKRYVPAITALCPQPDLS